MFLDEKKAGEAQTKADPFSLESLIAWLEKQPAGTWYNDCNPKQCLFAQFLGTEAPGMLSAAFGMWAAEVAYDKPHTFGAALERARHLQARS